MTHHDTEDGSCCTRKHPVRVGNLHFASWKYRLFTAVAACGFVGYMVLDRFLHLFGWCIGY